MNRIPSSDVVCAHEGTISQVMNLEQTMIAASMKVHGLSDPDNWRVFHFVMEPERVKRFANALLEAADTVIRNTN